MKRLFVLLSFLFCGFAFADTETINWYVGDTVYTTNTCTTGGDITLPSTPTKYRYTFQGWAGHTSIEYLKSDGNIDTYIDTGYKANNNVRVKTLFTVPSDPNADLGFVFGDTSNSNERYSLQLFPNWNSNGFRLDYANQINITCYGTTSLLNKNIILDVNNEHKMAFYDEFNNKLCETNIPYNIFSSTANMYIYNINQNGSPASVTSKNGLKIYYFQIYDNNVLVRDFIPVLDLAGTPCMYDKVTHQYFYNQGTGSFIAGPVINQ